jgi:predicted Zn finger-like uncharacterized protein
MIVTCPACATKYRVDDAALPAAGRTVRCRNCSHTWLELPSEEPVHAAEPMPQASPVETIDDDPIPPIPPGATSVGEAPTATPIPIVTEARSLAVAEPRTSNRLKFAWIALAAIIVVAVGALAIFRDGIVSLWPPAGRFYAAVGWPAHPGYGLQLSGVSVAPSMDNGQAILVLTGKIADVSMVALAVPKLHVSLLGGNQQVLQRIELDTGKASLRPGETTPFSFNIADPPHDALSVRVAFATP